MTDHYHGFDHPVLRDLPETPPADFLTEMDTIADELRKNPKHIADDEQIAFRQLQRLRLPDLSTQQFLDLFAVWRDRYQARQDAKRPRRPLASLHCGPSAIASSRSAHRCRRASALTWMRSSPRSGASLPTLSRRSAPPSRT
jgi:hypothetical protein